MKSYIQGLITGIILVASVVLFMSATDNPSDVGRFQVVDVAYQYITMHGSTSQNSVFKIDTKTGLQSNKKNAILEPFLIGTEPFNRDIRTLDDLGSINTDVITGTGSLLIN